MRTAFYVALVLLPLMLISGCSGPKAQEKKADAQYGQVEGWVLDDDTLPVPQATVTLRSLILTSIAINGTADAAGHFLIDRIPPGALTITASKKGYTGSQTQVEVHTGEHVHRNLTLVFVQGAAPFVAPGSPLVGKYDCAAQWGVGGGSCDALLPEGAPHPLNATPQLPYTVPAGWDGLLLELKWQLSGPSNAFSGVVIEVMSTNGTAIYARVEGTQSPVRVAINRGLPHPTASANATILSSGQELQLKVRPLGLARDQQCLVACGEGVGVVSGMDFSIYPTVFFGTGVDPNYSATKE